MMLFGVSIPLRRDAVAHQIVLAEKQRFSWFTVFILGQDHFSKTVADRYEQFKF